jgi:hypothetical protein
MSGLGFPSNPTIGQTYQTANRTYAWNGYAWAIQPSSGGQTFSAVTATSVQTQSLNVAGTATVNGAVILTTATITGEEIPLGIPEDGSLTNNNPAITTWLTTTYVTDAIDQLNQLLGKLIPPQPPAFPNGINLNINGIGSTLRMTNFTQTDNTVSKGNQVSSGTSVSNYLRSSSFSTNSISNVGPGDTGTVTVLVNGTSAGSNGIQLASTSTNQGTFGDLIISNYVDYGTIDGKTLGFWYCFTAAASGTVSPGWNNISMSDSAAGHTNTSTWYYDGSNPGTPVVTQTTFIPTTTSTAYSSGVPHYTSSAVWTLSGTANKLSGDMYPTSDTFLTGSSGGVFATPASVNYTSAGVPTPLARNLYVSSGAATFTTTVSISNITGMSASGPSVNAANGYSNGSLAFSPGGNVLAINPTDTSVPNENNIVVGNFGSGGSSYAVRVGGLSGSSVTPTIGAIAAWVSSATIQTTDATIVAGVIKYDTTNYSTGYFPVGPNLSSQNATQYITFRIQRAGVSKFNISFTGKIADCWVAMPGSSLGTTAAPTNGWITPTSAYTGAGVPGTGTGGNGSYGCSLAGVMQVNSSGSQNITVTFGTESSSNSTNNYIYVRFKMTSGCSITALSFPNPTN